MTIPKLFPSRLSQRTVENTILIVFALSLYTYSLGTIPPTLHLFEAWVDMQFHFLSGSWADFWKEYSQFGANDTNAAVRSPLWLALIGLSSKIFSDPIVAHRVPSVLITAMTPVLMAEITRRFFRKDMALFVGLACLGSQHFMFLGRIAGYVAPTTTLLVFIMLCAMSVAWENNRRAWIPLVLSFMIMPMMYSTIRYMSLMAPLIIGVQFLKSPSFRKHQLMPLIVSSVVLLSYMSLFAREGAVLTAVNFFRARGEQHLLTQEMIQGTDPKLQGSLIHRMSDIIFTTGGENLKKIVPNYWNGQRFFDWYYQNIYFSIHKWMTAFFLLGVGVAAVRSLKETRYSILILWSLLGWVPLLFTTGLTNNRMLNGLPADLFLVILGLMVPCDLVCRLIGERLKAIPYTLVLGALAYYISFSTYRMIVDCIQLCH
jgi:hypothetical protein